ncbi:fimbrial biogenesis outer membrane usher protein [Enterobacter ludwigii]|nr:fimbrial biogenesis outer membrane usher protein [Enterobacter ludwigii]
MNINASFFGCVTLIGTFFTSGYNWASPIKKDEADAVQIQYNPSFIRGTGIDISRFSVGNPVLPGQYNVMVWVNGQQRGKENIKFIAPYGKAGAEACFDAEQIKRLGIRITDLDSIPEDCGFIEEWVSQSKSHYDSGDFELNLSVPQINIISLPRGYIDPDLWQEGDTVGFVDYSGNTYSTFQSAQDERSRRNIYNSNLRLAMGFNYAGWRMRKQMNTTWTTGNSPVTQNLYGYAAHDVTSLKSEFLVGEANTRGDLFESYGLQGMMLQSEDRMLPDSLRVYTPVIRGIAETNARVTVVQRGITIHEVVVPPGPFELKDLGTMGYGGDLELLVTEADGRQRRQTIPFSAPPQLLHEGITNFAVSAGQLKDTAISRQPAIVQGTVRYGLNNTWTVYSGAQLGEKYRALAVGNAFNTKIGGVSFDVTHSQSQLPEKKDVSGNSYQINFSKYVGSTDTNLMLAAYRYTSGGFYTFREASLAGDRRDTQHDMTNFRTRHRVTATVSQRLMDNLSLYFSGSVYNYWGERNDSRQYSVTLNHSLSRFNYGLTAMRSSNENARDENTLLATVSIPLGHRGIGSEPLFRSLYSSVSHSDRGSTQFQTHANGSQGTQSELSYGVGGSGGNIEHEKQEKALSGNINYRGGAGQIGATASVSNRNTQQLSLSAAGSLVGHSGGVTAGPVLGDAPFAIINAQGAQGARLLNGYGSSVDGNGFAIMPSLTPYRENIVSLNARGLPETVDVLENEKMVVPRKGAAIAVNMKTITGVPMVLTVRDEYQQYLPIGMDIQTEHGDSLGVVGQGGMAFIRGWQVEQRLYAVSGSEKWQCIETQPTTTAQGTQILRLEVVCSKIES